jgi:hypothetical protein
MRGVGQRGGDRAARKTDIREGQTGENRTEKSERKTEMREKDRKKGRRS